LSNVVTSSPGSYRGSTS